jgi:hypothetical protein
MSAFNLLNPLLINSGSPSFLVGEFYMSSYYTHLVVANNGTAVAHDVRVDILYGTLGSENTTEMTEYIADLQKGVSKEIYVPIGIEQLKTFGNSTNWPVWIGVRSKETSGTVSYFSFDQTIS